MKKILITTLIITTLAMLLIPIQVKAVDLGINPDSYNPSGFNKDASALGESATNVVSTVLGIIQTIGSIASVIVLILIGLKFMLGSPEDRFEYKQSLKLYLIGAFLLFTLTWLPQLIYTFVTGILN